jgi:hypothetical protein
VIDSDDENENEVLRRAQELADQELARQLAQCEPEHGRTLRSRKSLAPARRTIVSDSDFEDDEPSSKKRKTKNSKKDKKASTKKAKEIQETEVEHEAGAVSEPKRVSETSTSDSARVGIEAILSPVNSPNGRQISTTSPVVHQSTAMAFADQMLSRHRSPAPTPSPERSRGNNFFLTPSLNSGQVGIDPTVIGSVFDSGHVIDNSQNSNEPPNGVVDISLAEDDAD